VKGAAAVKALRNAVPVLALAGLAAAGCFLISGQFAVDYPLTSPFPAVGAPVGTLIGVGVDLNTMGDYRDHKSDLRSVDDVALIGDFRNNTGSAANVEVWLVPSGTLTLPSDQLAANGVRLWGPLSVAAGATERVNWNRSTTLLVGRQALTDEIKGDGKFSLYVVANGTFDLTVTHGAVIAVVTAAK
jgi:hypothetical protein